jgi:hypothetical protein
MLSLKEIISAIKSFVLIFMPNQQLIDYIKQETEKGQLKDQIKQGLLAAGWPEADINEAFVAVESPNFVPVPNAAAPAYGSVQLTGKFLGPIELLKQTWQIYKARFWTLIGITIIPAAIIFLFGALIAMVAGTIGNNADNFLAFLPLVLIGLVAFLVAMIFQFWGQIASLYVIKGGFEEKIGIKEAFRRSWPKIGSYWWVGLLTGLVTMGGFFLFIIPGFLFAIWYGQSLFILVNEDIKGMNALIKSKAYAQGHWWGIFGRMLVMGLIICGIAFVVMIPVALISSILAIEAISSLFSNIFQLLVTPFVLIYGFSMYKSLKEAKGDFEFKPTGKGWLIAVAIFGGLIVPIAIIGMIVGMVFINMSSAPDAAQNAKMQSYMDQLRTVAVVYETSNIGKGYLGLETDSNYSMVCQRINGGCQAQISKENYCVKAELAKEIEATSYSQGGDYWCVDNNGYSGATEGSEYCTVEKPYCSDGSSSYPAY